MCGVFVCLFFGNEPQAHVLLSLNKSQDYSKFRDRGQRPGGGGKTSEKKCQTKVKMEIVK